MAAIQRLASRLWPVGWHPGGLGWALARGRLADEVVVFDGADGVLGWAARSVHEPGELLAQVDPSHREVADAIVDWLVDTAQAQRLAIDVHDGDTTLASTLRRAGFTAQPEARVVGMFRPPPPQPRRSPRRAIPSAPSAPTSSPRGSRCTVRRGNRLHCLGVMDATSIHRPRAPSPRTITRQSGASGRMTLTSTSSQSRRTRRSLGVVSPGSTRSAELPRSSRWESRPSIVELDWPWQCATRSPLECAAAGGDSIFINTGPREEYPAPSAAYAKAGFRVVERATTHVLSPRGPARRPDR